MILRRLLPVLRWLLLCVLLVTPCAFGLLSSYLMVLVAAIALPLLLIGRQLVIDRPTLVFAGAFATLAVLFGLTAQQPSDLRFALNFVAFLAFSPLASLLATGAGPKAPLVVAALALAGAAVGAGIGLIDTLVLRLERGGAGITDPIRLADTALILGFLALLGLGASRSRWRFIFLLGPVLALVTVFASGSRGPMLAFIPLLLVALLLLVRPLRTAVLLAGATCLGVIALTAALGIFASSRASSLLAIGQRLLSGSALDDPNTSIRFTLYRAGWQAFLESPWIGHGWGRLLESLRPYLAPQDQIHLTLPHLHNELLNFAVAGGLVGVAVCLVLLFMPLVMVLRGPRDASFGSRLYAVSIVLVAYGVLGLPDTMLSFEQHTSYYVGIVALVLRYLGPPATKSPAL